MDKFTHILAYIHTHYVHFSTRLLDALFIYVGALNITIFIRKEFLFFIWLNLKKKQANKVTGKKKMTESVKTGNFCLCQKLM